MSAADEEEARYQEMAKRWTLFPPPPRRTKPLDEILPEERVYAFPEGWMTIRERILLQRRLGIVATPRPEDDVIVP
jgi:hypothetical protein